MNEFQIVVDESVDYSVVTELRSKGYNVYAVVEKLPSIPDKEVLSVAFQNNALLITEDKDFGELVYRFQLPHKGILLVRMIASTSEEKAISVSAALIKCTDQLLNSFTVLDEKKIRIRKQSP
jgi:predicted nuclease of predicted toxin-antitoxin system